jgi:hypothetical protein
MHSSDEDTDAIPALPIINEALAVTAEQWRRLLAWAAPPLSVGLVLAVLSPSDLPAGYGGALDVAKYVALWLWVPCSVRIYRLTVLGELPHTAYARQLFEARAWRYVLKSFLAYAQLALLMMPIMAVAMTILFSLQDRLGYAGRTEAMFASPYYMLALGLSILLALVPMANRLVLIGPDAAVDGVASLSRIGQRSGPHRWLIVKGTVLIWALPTLLSGAALLLTLTCGNLPPLVFRAVTVCDFLVSGVASLVWRVAGGLVYKRVSAEWPVQDAAEQEERDKRLQLRSAKPFVPPPAREP